MGRRKKGDKINGWINLDKPLGLTSTQAMAKVRRILNAQKAGHAGTLDPLATGVLPIALGEATKTIPFAQDRLKTYEFTVTWGEQRDTDDSEGETIAISDVCPTPETIEALLAEFTGEIEQIPPKFSAIKIDGQRAYDLARGGEEVELKAREVFIESLKMQHPHPNPPPQGRGNNKGMTSSDFIMTCGKGTYVRSLARDMAEKLGTYGYVSALRRTAVGPFSEKNVISLEKLEEMGDKAREALLPLETVLDDIPALAIKEGEMAKFRNGQTVSFVARPDFERLKQIGLENDHIAIAMFQGRAVALVERKGPNIQPVRVFNM